MWNKRSQEKELIDLGSKYYSAYEYEHCMGKLFIINKLLGIFQDTIALLAKFPNNLTLVDVGCGNGLFLLHLSKYLPEYKLLGVDISSEVIQLANKELKLWKKTKPASNVLFLLKSQKELFETNFDIVLATLVCHHLNDDELIEFFKQSYKTANKAIIINDLQRHILPYFIYRILSPLLFRNRLITHDGLISIRRGFTRRELQALLTKSGITNYKLKWCFPFRWMIVIWKD